MNDATLWKILNASWWQVGLLVLCIGLGIWIITVLRNYFTENDDLSTEDRRLLDQAGNLRKEGSLSEQEYRKIKRNVSERLKDRTLNQSSGKDAL
ncbi:hypothetical protein [Lacunimicrobium album]